MTLPFISRLMDEIMAMHDECRSCTTICRHNINHDGDSMTTSDHTDCYICRSHANSIIELFDEAITRALKS